MTTQLTRADRPAWPKRAVVTAGMPYGNKGLHFGHVAACSCPPTSTPGSFATAWVART